MYSANSWKAIIFLAYYVYGEPSRALTLYQKPRTIPMFVPKTRRKFKQRILFLDEDEKTYPLGLGEIDLTKKSDSKIKFDDSTDYEFTSPEAEEPVESNQRFYDLQRLRPFAYPKFYQGRFARPYAPSFGFDPYQYAPPRTGFYGPNVLSGWKARSPRVVFPYAPDNGSNSVQTNSHGGPNFNDNVVFRDQNSGSDITTEDHALQDISTGSDAFSERDATDPHRARYNIGTGHNTKKYKNYLQKPMFIQTEVYIKRNGYEYPNATHESVLPEFKPISDAQIKKINEIIKELSTKQNSTNGKRKGKVLDAQEIPKETTNDNDKKDDRRIDNNCSQGGTCEFFFYCWMVGGLLEGSCGGLLKSCCHRVAKAGILGVQDSNSIDYSPNEGISYGPVINDESKCLRRSITPLRNITAATEALVFIYKLVQDVTDFKQ